MTPHEGLGLLAQRGLQGHLLRDFSRIGARAGRVGQIGRGLLGAGYVLLRWRKQGKTTTAQFDPLRRRSVKRLLEQTSGTGTVIKTQLKGAAALVGAPIPGA